MARGAPPEPCGPGGVYLHFPFCGTRCSYCDFATVAGADEGIPAYLAALARELEEHQRDLPPAIDTVYIGGGTPSRMSPEQVAGLLATVERRFDLARAREVTLECNPEGLDRPKLSGYRDAGVTRVSIGVQSLDDRVLHAVGRAHDGAQATAAAVEACAVAGLEVNVDLILGLPHERVEDWAAVVGRIARLGTDHVSVYLLEHDKDTPLGRSIRAGRVRAFDDDVLAAAYERTVDVLGEHGLALYEISNFARGGRVSRHNLKYWSDLWFAGFGLGAHGYCHGARRANVRERPAYVDQIARGQDPLGWREPWDARRRVEEALVLGLRRVEGIDLAPLGERYGFDLCEEYAPAWQRAGEAGLLAWQGTLVRLTARGRLCSNELFAELVRGEAA
jgi:oxygen-independent coproporphyrinogen-3 oxidase